jgi:hypothetical protein
MNMAWTLPSSSGFHYGDEPADPGLLELVNA